MSSQSGRITGFTSGLTNRDSTCFRPTPGFCNCPAQLKGLLTVFRDSVTSHTRRRLRVHRDRSPEQRNGKRGHCSDREQWGRTWTPKTRAWLLHPQGPGRAQVSPWELHPAPPRSRGCVLCQLLTVSSKCHCNAPHDQISPRLCRLLSGSCHSQAAATLLESLFTRTQPRPRGFEDPQTPEFRTGPPSPQARLHNQIRQLWPCSRSLRSLLGSGCCTQGSCWGRISGPRWSGAGGC